MNRYGVMAQSTGCVAPSPVRRSKIRTASSRPGIRRRRGSTVSRWSWRENDRPGRDTWARPGAGPGAASGGGNRAGGPDPAGAGPGADEDPQDLETGRRRRAANRFPVPEDRKTWRRPERSAGSARTSLRWPTLLLVQREGRRRRRASIRPWRGGRAGARSLRSSMTPVGVAWAREAARRPALVARAGGGRPEHESRPITPMRAGQPCGWAAADLGSRAAGCWSRAADRGNFIGLSPPPART